MAAVLIAGVLCATVSSRALADGPVGADPSSNFGVTSLPTSCRLDPTGPACVVAAVGNLDQARGSLGEPPYGLPADFPSLTPVEQAFILTDLDRILHGLPPIPGLTAGLDQDAATGVLDDADPRPNQTGWRAYTSNWAAGYENIVLAYEGWMYDDGPGGGNLDCSPSDSSGCWGHRHDVLWQFSGGGPLAMGAAAGAAPSGIPGYAMLILQQSPGAQPAYV